MTEEQAKKLYRLKQKLVWWAVNLLEAGDVETVQELGLLWDAKLMKGMYDSWIKAYNDATLENLERRHSMPEGYLVNKKSQWEAGQFKLLEDIFPDSEGTTYGQTP